MFTELKFSILRDKNCNAIRMTSSIRFSLPSLNFSDKYTRPDFLEGGLISLSNDQSIMLLRSTYIFSWINRMGLERPLKKHAWYLKTCLEFIFSSGRISSAHSSLRKGAFGADGDILCNFHALA